MDRDGSIGIEAGNGSRARFDDDTFESLVADAALRFACLRWEDRVETVRDTLERLRRTFGYDRATYAEFPTPDAIEVLCSTAAPGTALHPIGRIEEDLPWLRRELLAGRTAVLHDLPDCLPPEAMAEAERVRRMGVRSHLTIPLRVGQRIAGALSFASLTDARSWQPDAIRRLSMVGEMLATAVDRVRIEHEARALQGRFWHLDRVARTSALAAAIAHELNQPIAAILINAQTGLRDMEAGQATLPALRELLEAIVRDDRRASETIGSVRRLLHREEDACEPVPVGEALREVLDLLKSDLQRQGVGVESAIAPDLRVAGNRPQLQQVAINLLQNAMSAMADTPAGQRAIRVEVDRVAHGLARIRISDSGPGVPEASAGKIFEPLWTTRPDGLGLGLAICRSIVEAHGGSIRLAPGSDHGATFEIVLPALPVGTIQVGAPKREDERPRSVASVRPDTPLVAVVDDDAAVRDGVPRLLARAGFGALAWPDGPALLADPRVADAACILLDVRMPGMSGPEVHAALRARGLSVPAIYLTADDDVLDGVDAMKRGADDFLLKPVAADVLIAAVRSAVEHGSAVRERQRDVAERRSRLQRLTAREHDVLRALLGGRRNKQIAADLGISEPTVKQHRARVMEKMEVRSVAELVRACESITSAAARPARTARPHL